MTERCFDEGTIQAFLDGELTSDKLEIVARHISLCDDCANLLAESENESAFAFEVLEQEFNTLVPTRRLWLKINDSIGKERKSVWKNIYAYCINPTFAAFAALTIVFGLTLAMLSSQSNAPQNEVSTNVPNIKTDSGTFKLNEPTPIQSLEKVVNLPKSRTKEVNDDFEVVKTDYIKKEKVSKFEKSEPAKIFDKNPVNDKTNTKENYLVGEESYLRTIATLETTVNNRKDEVLKPSSRFAFENDLAVVNDAIKRMKAEVVKNPKNEAAKDFLRASYQSKIDLLNSVSEKTELMASLK